VYGTNQSKAAQNLDLGEVRQNQKQIITKKFFKSKIDFTT
jgi:hypothetical protein